MRKDVCDAAKAAGNVAKHGIPFDEAVAVFAHRDVLIQDASRAADGEQRSRAIAPLGARLFTVVFTERLGLTRVISARPSNAKERRDYERR